MSRKRRRHRKKNRWLWIALYAALVLCAFILFLVVYRILTYPGEPEMIPYSQDSYPRHDYDWSALNWDSEHLTYEDEKYTSRFGIDVSAHQEKIDWKAVKEQGVSFAFIRAGYRGYEYGYVNEDAYFDANMKGAQENGIDVGVYFFSQATNIREAAEEADYVLKRLKGYEIQLPVVFDMEEAGDYGVAGRTGGMSIEERTQCAVTFLRKVADAGYRPMIYNSSMLYEEFFDLDYLQEFEFWIADYDVFPKYDYVFSVWQYTSSGALDGIKGRVDLDLMLVPKEDE